MQSTKNSSEKKLLPANEAGRAVGYSTNYVNRLAREGSITASRDGRQWLVDLSSLQNFEKKTTEALEKRRETLRAERRAEFMEKSGRVLANEAGRAVGYSTNYVNRLAREGSITASRDGRQWFVDLSSLQGYVARVWKYRSRCYRAYAQRVSTC